MTCVNRRYLEDLQGRLHVRPQSTYQLIYNDCNHINEKKSNENFTNIYVKQQVEKILMKLENRWMKVNFGGQWMQCLQKHYSFTNTFIRRHCHEYVQVTLMWMWLYLYTYRGKCLCFLSYTLMIRKGKKTRLTKLNSSW